MNTHARKKRNQHRRHPRSPAREFRLVPEATSRPLVPEGPAVASPVHQPATENPDPERNPHWRLTEAGQQARLTSPWLMAGLVFGLPFVALVALGYLLQ